MWGVTFYFRSPPATFQQLQRKDKAHFIPSSLAVCEYHWRPLMICATGSYSILLINLENASKVCHVLLQGSVLNQSSKPSPQQSRSTLSWRLRPFSRLVPTPALHETSHFSLNPTSSPTALSDMPENVCPSGGTPVLHRQHWWCNITENWQPMTRVPAYLVWRKEHSF